MHNGVIGDSFEKHPGGGGREKSGHLIPKARGEAPSLHKLQDVFPSNEVKGLPNVKLEK
jgi:hypothetical protein